MKPAKQDELTHLVSQIAGAVSKINELQQQAIRTYASEVEQLLHTQSRDAQKIEHLLDDLLNCACLPEGLALFKSLCRHYYPLNPGTTADYINTYRDMWEGDSEENQHDQDFNYGGFATIKRLTDIDIRKLEGKP